jgi:small subunit ribosomal protein S21
MINAQVRIPRSKDPKVALDRALQRLKMKLSIEGVIEQVKSKRAFENPKQKRERKFKQKIKHAKKFFYKKNKEQ